MCLCESGHVCWCAAPPQRNCFLCNARVYRVLRSFFVGCKLAKENNLCRRAKSKCSCSSPWPHY
ncbi:hypothetical protein KC19_9G122300 [Ceratodon purpureus]|uniref:Uncharacterized protein n=1 Tax=Ceratodon purpureus TaxID=3225 RepID=A0A8T0GWQ5_CERPU|nr:hypothetical protein KC19_9G122300 [Ceratodon purpureus]